jgi:hypothetical protein
MAEPDWDAIRERVICKWPQVSPGLADAIADFGVAMHWAGQEAGAQQIERLTKEVLSVVFGVLVAAEEENVSMRVGLDRVESALVDKFGFGRSDIVSLCARYELSQLNKGVKVDGRRR